MRMPSENQRREQRFEFNSVVLPFLGSREADHLCFEYIPLDISPHGLRITIPQWVVSREKLQDNDDVNLHVPFRLNETNFNQGKVVWSKWDDSLHAQLCGVHMEKKMPLHCPVFIAFDTKEVGIDLREFASEADLVLRIFKDAILLKKGVLVYLNHLAPYFSRITLYPAQEYPMLKEFLFEDVKSRIQDNIGKLEALYEKARVEFELKTEISVFLNLEELRSMVESEIYLDLFKITFATDAILPFLSAIKELEKKQYANYNTIVMLYIKSL